MSEGDHIIPPDAERMFAQRMNATTISLNSSHASPVSHPDEIAQLILDGSKVEAQVDKQSPNYVDIEEKTKGHEIQ